MATYTRSGRFDNEPVTLPEGVEPAHGSLNIGSVTMDGESIAVTGRVDLINRPPHYTSHPSGVEVITITEHMNFCLGNAVKYILRADLKGSPLEDLRKARWYVDREIQRREASPDRP